MTALNRILSPYVKTFKCHILSSGEGEVAPWTLSTLEWKKNGKEQIRVSGEEHFCTRGQLASKSQSWSSFDSGDAESHLCLCFYVTFAVTLTKNVVIFLIFYFVFLLISQQRLGGAMQGARTDVGRGEDRRGGGEDRLRGQGPPLRLSLAAPRSCGPDGLRLKRLAPCPPVRQRPAAGTWSKVRTEEKSPLQTARVVQTSCTQSPACAQTGENAHSENALTAL